MTMVPEWFEPVTTQIITEGPAPIYWNIFWTGDSQYNPELRYCDVLYRCWWEETPLGIQCCGFPEMGQEGTPTSAPSSNSYRPTQKEYKQTFYEPPGPGPELQRHFVFECVPEGQITGQIGCCFEGSGIAHAKGYPVDPENAWWPTNGCIATPASQPTSTGPTGGVVYNSDMADTYPGSGPTGGMVLDNSNNSTIILPILIGLIVLAGIFLLVALKKK